MTNSMQIRTNTIGKWFVISAGAILFLTGIAKIWSSFGHVRILLVPDPLISIEFGHLFLLVGAAEIVIALVCFCSNRFNLQVGLIAWLATCFLFYRLGLSWIGWHKPCNCLGSLTDTLHISPEIADMAMKIILAYLLIGSYATLFWFWRQKRKEAVSSAVGATSL
jgi:hypothetical protein